LEKDPVEFIVAQELVATTRSIISDAIKLQRQSSAIRLAARLVRARARLTGSQCRAASRRAR
jgi:hypothetical protein